ncbi:MAG: xanthine dehydrogenase molybdopterin binding subunit [Candidatus Sericytochromatia bacterium]|nr:xanthine dehydrogenase molybdopterin binding subunit [Candidatus Sericytochromatia bacterium]
MSIIGKNIPHDSAIGHVTGESVFIDDMPFAKNELIVDFVGSPYAHGELISVDTSEAEKIEGIIGLYTYKDLDGINKFGPIIQDEHLLVEHTATFMGEPIVVIAGETRQAIAKAKKAIKIVMKELEPVFTIDEAIKREQYIGVPRFIIRGDVQSVFKTSEHILEGTFINGGQEQFYLESQASIAYPGEDNTLVIHSSTQHPSEIVQVAASILGLQQNQVICITKRMGGGFGGKESQACHFAVMAGLVALKTKRPARAVLNKDTDMMVTGKRHPFQNNYKVAFDKNGMITALKVDLFSNGGAAADLSTSILERAMLHSDSAYYLPNVEINGRVCKTNLPPNTAFRGFGGPQGTLNTENIIEEIAHYLKKDAYEIRRINCYGVNDRNITPYGQIIHNNVLPEIFDELIYSSDYTERLEAVKEFNSVSKTHLKGISLSPVKFGISFTTKFLNQGSALVNIYLDGTVQVSTGGTEMGQGLNTKIRQIVADEFSIDYETVRIMATSTEKNNNTSPTAASSGTDINGSAAVVACQAIRDRLSEFAAQYFSSFENGITKAKEHIVFKDNYIFDNRLPDNKIAFKDFVVLAYRERVSLGERGFYQTPGVDFNRDTGKGNPFLYFTNGAAVSEVLIDKFTGELKVLRSDILIDIGESINVGIDRGQVIGGFIQGMGWVTGEELKYNEKGYLLSHSPTTYKIPNITDVPDIFNVNFFKNDTNIVNVKKSKAVGEPPLLLGISVWTAVKHALSCVSSGKRINLSVPATNEEIIMAIDQFEEIPIKIKVLEY